MRFQKTWNCSKLWEGGESEGGNKEALQEDRRFFMGLNPLQQVLPSVQQPAGSKDKLGMWREPEVLGVIPGKGSQAGGGVLRSGGCVRYRTLITRKPT